MPNKPPASLFYWNDFTCSVSRFTNEEVGIYMRLLADEWVNGPLPTEIEALSSIARITPEKMSKLWEKRLKAKFILTDDGYIQNRMEEERSKMESRSKVRARLGKQGAKKRWKREAIAKAITKPMAKEWQRKLKIEIEIEDKNRRDLPEEVRDLLEENVTKIETLFDKWWSLYPNKVDKDRSMMLFAQAIAEAPEKERHGLIKDLFEKLAAYKQTPKWLKEDGEYIPMPSTWLYRKRWKDQVMSRSQHEKQKEEADRERFKEMEAEAARRREQRKQEQRRKS